MTKIRILMIGVALGLIIVAGLIVRSVTADQDGPASDWNRYDSKLVPVSLMIPPQSGCTDTTRDSKPMLICDNESVSEIRPADSVTIGLWETYQEPAKDAIPISVGRRRYPGYLWIRSAADYKQNVLVSYLAGSQQWYLIVVMGKSHESSSVDHLDKVLRTILANIDHG